MLPDSKTAESHLVTGVYWTFWVQVGCVDGSGVNGNRKPHIPGEDVSGGADILPTDGGIGNATMYFGGTPKKLADDLGM